jgi:hypothetical protein
VRCGVGGRGEVYHVGMWFMVHKPQTVGWRGEGGKDYTPSRIPAASTRC